MASRAMLHMRNLSSLFQASSNLSHCYCQRNTKKESKIARYMSYIFIRSFSRLINKSPEFPSKNIIPLKEHERSLASKATNKKDLKKIAGRKPNIKQGPEVLYHELPIMFVNANYNNTMFTITDHQGLVVAWTSAGVEGFKGAKRGTNYAGQMAATAAAKKARTLGVETCRVKIKGMGPARQSSIKGLIAGGINIVSITDVTPVPHNGCKPPKQRRI